MVDFVVWLLFSREPTGSWPRHLLCDGFRRLTGPTNRPNPAATTTIPGLYSAYPNQHVQALKASPWPQLLLLLGKEGERIMLDLLVDCAVFRFVKAGKGNLYQLVGTPVSELESLAQLGDKEEAPRNTELRPSEISFVRSRMLYARAALNARGLVHFGLRHIRVSPPFQPHYLPLADTPRCPKPLPLQDPTPANQARPARRERRAHHDVHLPAAVRAAQRLHVDGRPPADVAEVSGLYVEGRGDCGEVSAAGGGGREAG